MILLVVAALLGAMLGLAFRTALLAIAVALAAAGVAQFGAMSLARAMSGRAGTAQLAASIQGVVGSHASALIPTLAAAGCGAAIAALMLGWADRRRSRIVLIPSDLPLAGGRKRRQSPALAAIEARPAHAAAESRIQRIMKQ